MHKYIIYLASGASRRFGSNKLLHELDGKPMFLHGLEMLGQVVSRRRDCSLLVVSRYAAIRRTAEAMGIPSTDSPESALGIAHTIRAGILALGEIGPEDHLLFVVADQPYLGAASVCRLLDAAGEVSEGACLCWGDRPGNPTLFSARLLPELLALEGDVGGRAVLRRHSCLRVPTDSLRELEDIDCLM